MSDDRIDLPPPNAKNFNEKVREALSTYLGKRGDKLDRGVTLRDLVEGGIVTLRAGYSSGGSGAPIGGVGGAVSSGSGTTYTEDLTPPPTPTGVVVSSGLSYVFIETDTPAFTVGNGYARTYVYGAIRASLAAPLPVFGDASVVHEFVGPVGSFPTNPNTIWHIWLKWETVDGVFSVVPSGLPNGAVANTGLVGNSYLGAAIIEAANLADGSVSASKIAASAITATKFANTIEPVTLVTGTLPAVKSTSTIFRTDDGKLYRWNGTAYVATVPTGDLTGTVISAQIADSAITTAKFAAGIEPVEIVATLPATGNFAGRIAFLTTDNKLYRHNGTSWISSVPSTDITGTLLTAQIADSAITTAKFASTIEPLTIVTGTLPTVKSTSTIFRTDDSKTYRWSGTAYVATIPTGDLSGSITSTQITDGAISTIKLAANAVTAAKITAGTITSTEIATDTIVAGNIAAGAISTTELAANAVTAAKIAVGTITANELAANTITAAKIAANTITAAEIAADTITAGQIAAGAISTTELAANAVTAAKIAVGTITANELAANTITAAKIAAGTITTTQIASDTIVAGNIAAGAISASEIAAGAITTAKLLVTGRGKALNADPSFQDDSAWVKTAGGGTFALVSETTSPVGTRVLRATNDVQFSTLEFFPATAGTRYKLSCWVRRTAGTGLVYLRVYFYTQAGGFTNVFAVTQISPAVSFEGFAASSTWTKYIGYIDAPATATQARIITHVNWATTGSTDVADMRCEEYIGADLIVDGAIIASKLAANAIVAGSAAIQDAAITNAKIGLLAVDAARMADLTVTGAKIADAAITNAKISGTIQSDNYSAGTAGWAITKSSGAAEFGAASIRGQLTASQINSNGLSIKDTAGNVILSAGASLAASSFAFPGTVTNKPEDILNSNVTATGIGAVQTSLTNAPAGILNSSVSISAAGTLSGAGGGAVTIGGLGYTGALNATANVMTSGTLALRPTGADGDTYFATDNNLFYQKVAGAWVQTANNYTNTNQLTDGANLGTTANYANLTGTPATTIANSAVTLSAAGALSGAGGGTVTIGGLGYTGALNATANVMTSGTLALRPVGANGDTYFATDNNIFYQKLAGAWVQTATVGATATEATKLGGIAAGATVGADFSTNLVGQINAGNISTFIAGSVITNAYIGGAIQSTNYAAGTAGWSINKDGTAEFNTGTFRSTLLVGTTPAVSGTTMTGSGGVINGAGTFALGNATRNISFNGTTLTMNGDVVVTGNIQSGSVTTTQISTPANGVSGTISVVIPAGQTWVITVVAYAELYINADGIDSTFATGSYTFRVTVNGSVLVAKSKTATASNTTTVFQENPTLFGTQTLVGPQTATVVVEGIFTLDGRTTASVNSKRMLVLVTKR